MHKYFVVTVLGIFLGAAVSFYYYDKYDDKQSVVSKNVQVVVTTEIIADAVRAIGGDKVTVQALMGPGVDPHLYHARESDVQRLANADIIFYNGLHLEGKMGLLFDGMKKRLPTYGIADFIEKKRLQSSGFDGLYDPHVWFDVQLWILAVNVIRDKLIEHDPSHAKYYSERALVYTEQLQNLDAYIKQRVAELPEGRRVLITAHDAFNYFGKAYGFKVIGLQGISTDSEVGTADVTRLVESIVKQNVPALFTEASIPARNIEAVQRAAQARGQIIAIGPELYSDTLGEPGTVAETYQGMVRYNIDAIVEALF